MPSKLRSLFRRKNNTSPTADKAQPFHPSTPSTPPLVPVDPDGESASHSSAHEIYLSHGSTDEYSSDPSPSESDVSAPVMTASQFKTAPNEEMDARPHVARTGRDCEVRSREGVPIITAAGADHFNPSAVTTKGNYATEGFYSRGKQAWGGKERPKVRPSAKNSAFGGAPRYDWMDIETTAAVKIQALYRRVRTQNRLDEAGLSTPGMRNRRARLQARYRAGRGASADVPFPFSLCGVGLLFGDGTLEDERVVQGLERRQAEQQKGRAEQEDEDRRRWRMRKKESQKLEEGIEVVESFEEVEGEEDEEEDTVIEDVVSEEEEEEVRDRGSMRSRLARNMSRSMGSSPRRNKE